MVEVCGVSPFHPLASASSKESLNRKNSSSVALHTRKPRSAARSSWRRGIWRGETSTGAPAATQTPPGRPSPSAPQDLAGRDLDRRPLLVGEVADDERRPLEPGD